MPEPQGAPMGGPEGGGGGEPDVEAMIVQAYESQDPQMALETINVIAEMSGLAGQGQADPGMGAPPMEMAPEDPAAGGMPMEDPGMPMGRWGMKIPKLKKSLLK
jgi:hypothetical protein